MLRSCSDIEILHFLLVASASPSAALYLHFPSSFVFLINWRWSHGRAPDCQSRGRWFNPTYRRFETEAISFTPHLPVYFGRDTKSRWSLLSGVYARGSERSHTGGKCVTCSGLTNSREGQLSKPSSTIF